MVMHLDTSRPYCFFTLDGKPEAVVALISASTFVLASSKVTTASAFCRFMSALATPGSRVNDLFTEITHDSQTMFLTESVTV